MLRNLPLSLNRYCQKGFNCRTSSWCHRKLLGVGKFLCTFDDQKCRKKSVWVVKEAQETTAQEEKAGDFPVQDVPGRQTRPTKSHYFFYSLQTLFEFHPPHIPGHPDFCCFMTWKILLPCLTKNLSFTTSKSRHNSWPITVPSFSCLWKT